MEFCITMDEDGLISFGYWVGDQRYPIGDLTEGEVLELVHTLNDALRNPEDYR